MAVRNAARQLLRSGFTLIELSIVLVIIGLIAGGILAGRDLIKAAQIRATVGQIEKYNTAVNTFQSKYGGIPGDLIYTDAIAFGLFSNGMNANLGVGYGDGNGLIEDATNCCNSPRNEILVFWRQLSDAGLNDGSIGSQLAVSGTFGPPPVTPDQYMPQAKIGGGSYVTVGSDSGANYYMIEGFGSNFGINAMPDTVATLTPIEAYDIDSKVDDGMPNTGRVQARGTHQKSNNPFVSLLNDPTAAAQWSSPISPVAGDCMTSGSAASDPADTYNVSGGSGGDTAACSVRWQFQ